MTAGRQSLTILLSIALVAIDAVVGALGHCHVEALDSHDAGHVACHHGACSGDEDEHSAPTDLPPDDDCSLCRHFSQPVVVAIVSVELIGSIAVQPVEPALRPRIVAVSELPHPARGPPTFFA